MNRNPSVTSIRFLDLIKLYFNKLILQQSIFSIIAVLFIVFLVFFNLTSFPQPWFDEGSYLHIPKNLVRLGVYADSSSEGFRFYGPAIGVGPTVMLPIAGVFKVFGIGLLQARLVMAGYLLAAIYIFFRFSTYLGGVRFAWLTTALILSSRSVLFLEYGRQLLGEVPGLLFILAGIWLWFSTWENPKWLHLTAVGLLLGLGMITKYQYLLFILPTMGVVWLANLVYYRIISNRTIIIPAVTSMVCFGIWQVIMILYLGPNSTLENFAMLRESAGSAAFVFLPSQMVINLEEIMGRAEYLGWILPSLFFGLFLVFPRNREGLQWFVLFLLVITNLGWFIVASVGWIRYAFLGFALSSLFVGRFIFELTGGLQLHFQSLLQDIRKKTIDYGKYAINFTIVFWLMIMVMSPLVKTLAEIVIPGPNAAEAMASYLNENVPQDKIIETWSPEMGFFTNHNYHFPPNSLLSQTIEQVYFGGPPVSELYSYFLTEKPPYLLLGEFADWVNIYPADVVQKEYKLIHSEGNYHLYSRNW